MWPSYESLSLSDQEFLLLRDLVRERTGLMFDDSKREMLADRLSRRAIDRGFESLLDYYYLLKYDPSAEDEWRLTLDELSVPETYFWREMDQIRALVNTLVPRHFADRQAPPLRIWTAACATGEEPLTIAMALSEAGWLGRRPIEIVASDGSGAALAKARAGRFGPRSFRSLPLPLRDKYFREEQGAWRVDPSLAGMIRWERANLAQPGEFGRLLPAQVIFCRNVFIYFCPEAMARTVRNFALGMQWPGYLFVGVAESLLRATNDFELQEIDDAFVYVLKPRVQAAAVRVP